MIQFLRDVFLWFFCMSAAVLIALDTERMKGKWRISK